MTRLTPVFLMLVFVADSASAQSIAAPRFLRGGAIDAIVRSATIDGDGNFYFFGASPTPLDEEIDPPGSVDVDPGPEVWPLPADEDLYPLFFVGKTDPELNLLWFKKIRTGEGPDIYDIAVDSNGNVFATGWQLPTNTDFGEPGHPYIVSGQGTFIWKLKPDGTTEWVRIWGPNSPDFFELETDSDGNVYAAGILGDTLDLDLGPGNHTITPTNLSGNGTDPRNALVLSLDEDGNFRWAGHFAGAANVQPGMELAVDDDGTVFVVSEFYGQVDADPDPSVARNYFSDSLETLVVSLTDEGSFVWARHRPTGFIQALCADGEGGALAAYHTTLRIIERYSPQGALVWERSIVPPNGGAYIEDIALGTDGDFYIYGGYSQQVTISSIVADRALLTGSGRFVARWDVNGTQLWCEQFTRIGEQSWETNGYSGQNRIFPSRNGELVITALLVSVLDADPSPSTSFALEPYNHLDYGVFVLGSQDEVWTDFDLITHRRMDGTLDFPLRSFSRAVRAIDAGETITIVSPGAGVTSAETGVFSKPATIRVLGAPARIGQQTP